MPWREEVMKVSYNKTECTGISEREAGEMMRTQGTPGTHVFRAMRTVEKRWRRVCRQDGVGGEDCMELSVIEEKQLE